MGRGNSPDFREEFINSQCSNVKLSFQKKFNFIALPKDYGHLRFENSKSTFLRNFVTTNGNIKIYDNMTKFGQTQTIPL